MDQGTAQHENQRHAQRAARNARLDAELERYSVKRWLSVPQWARARGVSVWFAYAEARKGRLKITKAGRRSIITADADKQWSDTLPTLNMPAVADQNATNVDPAAPPTSQAT